MFRMTGKECVVLTSFEPFLLLVLTPELAMCALGELLVLMPVLVVDVIFKG